MSLAIHTDVKEPAATPAEIAKVEAKVSVKRLNFYYGAYRALADINVDLLKNKVTAFIGPSGCGKSTLLRILNRIYDLYPNQRAEGEVLLDGETIGGKTTFGIRRLGVARTFQSGRLFSELPVIDNERSAAQSGEAAITDGDVVDLEEAHRTGPPASACVPI